MPLYGGGRRTKKGRRWEVGGDVFGCLFFIVRRGLPLPSFFPSFRRVELVDTKQQCYTTS
jgi:hypothetical protein